MGEQQQAARDEKLAQALERTWHHEIPLSAAMQLRVEQWRPHSLLISADLEPNINVHGTAFAGSLYAIAALSGWGLLHLELAHAGFDASIVIADGQIRYLQPVAERITACGYPEADAELDTALETLRERGRTKVKLAAIIHADGEPAVTFSGLYAVRER